MEKRAPAERQPKAEECTQFRIIALLNNARQHDLVEYRRLVSWSVRELRGIGKLAGESKLPILKLPFIQNGMAALSSSDNEKQE